MPTVSDVTVPHQPRDIYGWRARIGYTSPPAATEVFPYEFYLVAPPGVSLVVSTLAIVEMDAAEVDQSFDISLRAAKELARAQVDLLVLGGVPINRAHGSDVEGLAARVERTIGVPVTTSTAAQVEALRAVGARNVAVGHPFPDDRHAMMTDVLVEYGLNPIAHKGAGFPADYLGRIPRSTAMDLARHLLRVAPKADTLWLPCPHWAVAESIEPIEKEFGVSVITAHQAITWKALRSCGVKDCIEGFGKLFREF
jgi:maleate cis-trans isomerase